MTQSDMPTMRSRRLGNELKRLRLAAGLKVQDAATRLMCGQPKISQIETGRRGIRPLDLSILMELYGVEDRTHIANIKRLAKEIHKVDWWSSQGPILDDSLKDYLTLESDSELVCEYSFAVIPGMFQTEAYMRQMFTEGHPPEKVEPLVATRLKRQELLNEQSDFRVRAVIDVTALHRIRGTEAQMREQLAHLVDVGRKANVNIQILPLRAQLPADQYPPFTIHSLRGEPPVQFVWLEHLTSGTLLEQRSDVQSYRRLWDDFTAAALSPSESRRYIRDLIKDSGA
ncbi:Scr1 family TA system antitoxin-like transcriptional regulator [Streptomyces sp. DW26H14]|uniref:Scr1 family TA system antitoxin-like transcriptional regulator n=1 Tax=Streptomyces sp. DW26H14 TaxID=3435395 RepID=UPI00403D9B88